MQEGHQLHRTRWIRLTLCGFRLSQLFTIRLLLVFVATQPGGERSFGSGLPQLLPLRVVDDAVALEALPHRKGLPAACVCAGEGPQLLVEGADVALQVEQRGERPAAVTPRALVDHPCVSVDSLMLLQEPGVPEHLAALVTLQDEPVLLLPVLQILGPGLPSEAAALLLAGVSSVHLLMTLQFAGEGESHLAPVIGALVGGQLGVLLTHVGLELLVLPELQAAALVFARVLLLLLGVDAADMSDPVRVGGEGLPAAVHGALEGLHAAVAEVVSSQVVAAAERLPAAIAVTCVRLQPGVFTQVRVQFPLFVISRRAVRKRADVTFVRLRFHFCDMDEKNVFKKQKYLAVLRSEHVFLLDTGTSQNPLRRDATSVTHQPLRCLAASCFCCYTSSCK